MRWTILITLAAGQVWACQCSEWPSAKQAWQGSPLVFLGTVERTDPSSRDPNSFAEQTLWVRVDEPFKGTRAQQTLILHQPGHNCAPKYNSSAQVLFYLHPTDQPGVWSASGCHRSRPLSAAADDLLFLRALPNSAKKNRLSGEVDLYETSIAEGFRKVRGLFGVRVTITGGGQKRTLVTNADGAYEVYDLPTGTYNVQIEVPRGLKLRFPLVVGSPDRGKPEVSLTANSSGSVSFVLMADNQISGRVLGLDGKPRNDVCVKLEPKSGPSGRNFYITDCAKVNGRYALAEMPPGQYRIAVNDSDRNATHEPFPRVYYPGTTDYAKSSTLTIGTGEHLEGIDIQIPPLPKLVRLSGRLEFNDGTPVNEQSISFQANDDPNDIQRTITGVDGGFQLSSVAGKPGEIYGGFVLFRTDVEKCPQWAAAKEPGQFFLIVSTPHVFVPGDSDQVGLTLVLPLASCKDWPKKP